MQSSMAGSFGLRVTLSFISVLKFAIAIGQVAGALTLVLFLICVIVRFLVASTPGLATIPEDAVPILGVYFLPCNVQYVYMSPSNDAMPLHSKYVSFH